MTPTNESRENSFLACLVSNLCMLQNQPKCSSHRYYWDTALECWQAAITVLLLMCIWNDWQENLAISMSVYCMKGYSFLMTHFWGKYWSFSLALCNKMCFALCACRLVSNFELRGQYILRNFSWTQSQRTP